jgi:hypothetical protein
MADWDVVGAAPAQIQNPWAVRSLAPAPKQTDQNGKPMPPIPKGESQGPEKLPGVSDAVDFFKSIPGGIANGLHALGTMLEDPVGAYQNLQAGVDKLPEKIGGLASEPGQVGDTLKNLKPETAGEAVGETVGVPGALGAVSKGLHATEALGAAADMSPAGQLGLRTATNAPIARTIAGKSGQEALNLQNVGAGNTIAGAEAGVPHGVPVTPTSLAAARVAPGETLDRAAAELPAGPLSPNATRMIQGADDTGRITQGTPNAVAQIQAIKDRLLDPNAKFTGQQIRAEANGLRHDADVNSPDPDIRNVSIFRRKVAAALDQHVEDMLPADSSTSLAQVKLARQTLAKNYTVQDLLGPGNDVDLQKLAQLHRDEPNLLTGNLRTLADFANQHPEVSSLPSAGTRYAPPGLGKDLGQINIINPRSWVQPLLGAAARRSLTGSPEAAAAAAQRAPVAGAGGEFNPIDRTPQPPPGMTASPPSTPPAAPAGPPGQISLADLLSHGVEQPPTPGLSSGPMAAPEPGGVPFQRNAAHEAGGLTLDELLAGPRTYSGSNADLPAVMSQGVPEGTVARTAQNPGLKMKVAHSPSFIENNASGESAASQEAINRGTKPLVEVDPDGVERPILRDVTQADIEPTRGHLIVDKSTGQIVKSGGMAPILARGLLERWKSRQRSLGEAF